MFEKYYDVLVTFGPTITIIGFFGFYGITIYMKHKTKTGTKLERYSFSLLLFALFPNFLAHMALAIVHGAWMPLVAEIVNIVPVVYVIVINEYYFRKNVAVGIVGTIEEALLFYANKDNYKDDLNVMIDRKEDEETVRIHRTEASPIMKDNGELARTIIEEETK